MHVFIKFFLDFFQGFESSLSVNSESMKKFQFFCIQIFQKIKAVQNQIKLIANSSKRRKDIKKS